MKLSMWILADALWKYSPIIYIKDGSHTLRGVRYFSREHPMERQNVYLGKAQDFIGTGGDGVICVNGHDMILLDTNDTEQILNEIFEAFDFYNNWSDSLMEMIHQGCSIQKIVLASSQVFDQPIIVYDSNHRVIAQSPEFTNGELDPEWGEAVEKLATKKADNRRLKQTQKTQVQHLPDINQRCICTNLFNVKMYIGQLITVAANHKITDGRVQLSAFLGSIIEYWMRFNDESRESSADSSMFTDLLKQKSLVKSEVLYKLHALGWKDGDRKIVLKIANPDTFYEQFKFVKTSLVRRLPGCYTVVFSTSLVIIANLELVALSTILGQLEPLLKKSRFYCGVSNEFTDIFQLFQYYRQAEIAINYGNKTPEAVNYSNDCSLDYILTILRSNVSEIMAHPALNILREHDARHNSDLYHTLHQYILNERNLIKTAEKLCIHRNSLIYRIKKIDQLLELCLDDEKIREYLLISYRLLEQQDQKT